MSEPLPPGQPIPIPENFPVVWENPEDAKLSWGRDSHTTTPQTPLGHAVGKAVVKGFNAAFPQLGLPIQFRTMYVNGYPYAAVMPTAAPPEAVMKTMGVVNQFAPGLIKRLTGRMSAQMTKQQLDKLNPILARFDSYWQDDLLPEINRHFAYFESFDLRGLSQAQLRAHFVESLKRAEKLGEIHALAGFPAILAMSLFIELYQELFPDTTSLDALRLLQGFDNRTLTGDRQLWQLSRSERAVPAVQQIITDTPVSEVVPSLGKTVEGRHFLKEFRAYLQQHGQRLNAFGRLYEPSWVEDPTIALECLKAYIIQPDTDPESEQSWLASEREKAVADARVKAAGYPQPVRDRFETLLKAAQCAVGIKEDNHWVVERLFYHMRQVALAFGRRLAESGMLEDAEDVFYLTADELLDAGDGHEPSLGKIQQRKAEREHFRHIPPPTRLGTIPRFALDDSSLFSQAVKKADGGIRATWGGDAHGLQGLPGSGGAARGPAKVIHTLAEAGKLQPGDVLVAPSTMPPWTPLFGIAAAVVTDTGGVLSHCAIVAREYRIPAVVGTGSATKVFQDGQMLEVDGDAGMVRLVISPEKSK